MATSKKQRAGILIIMVATVLGTLGSFAVMILSMQSNKQAQADYQKVLSEYKKEQTAYEQKKQAQADELSAKYKNVEFELHNGGQPVYYYFISVE